MKQLTAWEHPKVKMQTSYCKKMITLEEWLDLEKRRLFASGIRSEIKPRRLKIALFRTAWEAKNSKVNGA